MPFMYEYGVVPINLFQWPASGQSLPSVGILSLVNIRPHPDPHCRMSAEKSWAIGGNDRSRAGSPRIIRSASSPSLARKQATRDWRIPLIPSAMLSVAMKACFSEARSLASSKSTWGARTFDTRGEVDEDGRGQDGRPLITHLRGYVAALREHAMRKGWGDPEWLFPSRTKKTRSRQIEQSHNHPHFCHHLGSALQGLLGFLPCCCTTIQGRMQSTINSSRAHFQGSRLL